MTQHYWECSTLSQTRKHNKAQCMNGQFLFDSIKAKEHGFSIYFINSSLCRVPGPNLLEQYNNVASLPGNMRAAFMCKDCCHWLERFQWCHWERFTVLQALWKFNKKLCLDKILLPPQAQNPCICIHPTVQYFSSVVRWAITHHPTPPPTPHPQCLGSDIQHTWQLHLLFSRFICVMLIFSSYLKLSLGFGEQFIGDNDHFHAFDMNLHRRASRYWQYHLDKCCWISPQIIN